MRVLKRDREQVLLRSENTRIDSRLLSEAIRKGVSEVTTDQLESLATLPRGEFLEGLHLLDFLDFNAWCVAERERLRKEHCLVLSELLKRLEGNPIKALLYARLHARIEAFDASAQVRLLRLLVDIDHHEEARERFESTRRFYREVGAAGLQELEQARGLVSSANLGPRPTRPALFQAVAADRLRSDSAPTVFPFVGRQRELAALEDQFGQSCTSGVPLVALVTGEPGSGKSRLAERFTNHADSAGFKVYSGRAYEAEGGRPYGPWVDALHLDIQELAGATDDDASSATRERLFAAVEDSVAQGASHHEGVLLILDDLQWFDRDSAELLHFIARSYRKGSLFILLLARPGELTDNEAAVRTLRGVRKHASLAEVEVEPLSLDEIAVLIGRDKGVDVEGVYEASAGNPLYAIELVRARADGADHTPSTLLQLIRERVEELPQEARDVLRWGAVLGHAMDVERLEALSSLEQDELVEALERLEARGILRIDATRARQRYVFGHDVVREAVYAELSHPRRRLMHRKVAQLLERHTSEAAVATEVAHHAGMAGEALLGVRACVIAGNQSLRVFANSDAEVLAKKGLRLVSELEGAERMTSTLDLLRLQFAARTPNREEAAAQVRSLAEEALDLGLTGAARLGFQMLSYLRWESSSMADAHENIMQAERVSRASDPEERTAALAQAAKCLVLLERNLGQAEAFAMEADGLAKRAGHRSSAVSFATGMIAAHRGEFDAAVEAFREAYEVAREHGEHLAEFCAVEHWTMLEIDRGRYESALKLAKSVAELGGRVRSGAEGPAGRALLSFAELLCGGAQASALHASVEKLRKADAKYELAFLLTRWANHELMRERMEEAELRATDALEVAQAIGRPSDIALARVVLARCARQRADQPTRQHHVRELINMGPGDLSRTARDKLESVVSQNGGSSGEVLRRHNPAIGMSNHSQAQGAPAAGSTAQKPPPPAMPPAKLR